MSKDVIDYGDMFNPVYVIEGIKPTHDTGTYIIPSKHYGVNVFPWDMEIPSTILTGTKSAIIRTKSADTLRISVTGTKYTTYRITNSAGTALANSYVNANAAKAVNITVDADSEYIFGVTNSSGSLTMMVQSQSKLDNIAIIYVSPTFSDIPNGTNVIDEDHFVGTNVFVSLTDIPEDMTKGIRVIKYIASDDGTWTFSISATAYTTLTYDGKNSYVQAGETKTFSVEALKGETYLIEFTNVSGIYTFTSDVFEVPEPLPEGASPDDDTQDTATVVDIKETPSFSSLVGEADPVDWFEITNFDVVRTTFTLSVETGDDRATIVIYALSAGSSSLRQMRSTSTTSSVSTSLALAANTRYFIKVTGTGRSSYTITIAQ